MKKVVLVNERENPVTANINIPTSKYLGKNVELAVNLFNPHHESPPNVFINKLTKRMKLYK